VSRGAELNRFCHFEGSDEMSPWCALNTLSEWNRDET